MITHPLRAPHTPNSVCSTPCPVAGCCSAGSGGRQGGHPAGRTGLRQLPGGHTEDKSGHGQPAGRGARSKHTGPGSHHRQADLAGGLSIFLTHALVLAGFAPGMGGCLRSLRVRFSASEIHQPHRLNCSWARRRCNRAARPRGQAGHAPAAPAGGAGRGADSDCDTGLNPRHGRASGGARHFRERII